MSKDMNQAAEIRAEVGAIQVRIGGLETKLDGLSSEVKEQGRQLNDFRRTAGLAYAELRGDVHDFKHDIERRMSEGFERVMTRLDDFAGVIEQARKERLHSDRSISELRGRVDDQELRLTRVELRGKDS